MTSAANNQGFGSNWGNPNWTGPGNYYRGPWGNFHWGAMPPWFPPQAAKPVLIVATILGFVFWWPVGLVLLAVLMVNRHACGGWRRYGAWQGPGGPNAGGGSGGWQRWTGGGPGGSSPSSGNRAFDEYRADTLRRLEDEQKEFAEFLDRLRVAKDKSEFDQFMNERRNRPAEPPPAPPAQG
jgi:Protein of unknown function (DUF2852)